MKKVLAWVLLLTMLLGLFAGCKRTETPETTAALSGVTAAQAIEYLKAVYPNTREATKTAVDYERMAVVRINDIPLDVVWTVNVTEDLVKVVPNDDGTVTIDVKEKSEVEVPYTLTATVTDDTGASASHSWECVLPAYVFVDMAAVVEEAYKLAEGQSMDYEVTLTGKIIRVKDVYSADYKNISVIIEVEGAEDKPILCYRMKGDGCDKLKIGDTITVTGILTNYKGTIEFEAGCTLDAYIEGEGVEAPEDVGQILKEAYALAEGKALPYEVTLTGKITKINTPYDTSYKNVSVTMVVDGYEKYPVLCYRIKGEGADNLFIGDTITVRGYIVNYNGTIEFEAGSALEKVEKTGKEIKAPSDVKQILKEAYALKENDSLPYEVTLTGVISRVDTEYSSSYNNVTVTMVVDGISEYPIKCYRMKGDGVNKIGKGDTITVTGWITNYKGTIEFAAGCSLDSWSDTGKDEVEEDGVLITTLVPEVVENPVPGTAYKFYFEQKTLKKTLYLTGEMDGYYYATTEDPEKAADVYLEQVSGGYRAYILVSGRKNYLEIVQKGDYTNVIFTTSPSATLKWNTDIKSVTCNVGGTDYYFGSYSSYKTFSASKISYVTGDKASTMDVTNFVGRFATLKESEMASKSPAEQVYLAIQETYFAEDKVTSTPESYTHKSVYDVKGTKVNVKWTVDNKAVSVVDNNDGTVTIKVTRGKEDIAYTLTATIVDGDKTYTVSGKCKVPAVAATTPEAIVNAAYALQPGESLPDTYTLTGVIIGTDTPYSEQYKNVSVVIVVGNMDDKPIMCYRLKGDGADQIGKGDTITVTGLLKNYNGIIEFDSGCTLDSWKNTGSEPPATEPDIELQPGTGNDDEDDSNDNVTTTLVPEIVTNPTANTAYKFMVDQKNLNKKLYLTGEMNGYYYGTTTNPEAAVDVYLEQVSGGYRVYFEKNGVKQYLEIVKSGTYTNVVFVASPTKTLKWNAEINSVTCDVEGEDYYFGTYSSYQTFSASTVSRVTGDNASTLDVSNFVGHFVTLVEGEDEPTEPTTPSVDPTEPSVDPTEPDAETPVVVTCPVVGTAYKFMVNQKTVGKVLYLTGEMNGYYFATTENIDEAADVYLEVADGGYYLYVSKDGAKSYMEIVKNGTYTNVVFTDSPTKTLKWNAEINSVTCDVDGTDYYFGAYNNYVTFSASKISYVTGDNASTMDETNFVAHFATLEAGEEPTDPTEPSVDPTEPSVDPTEPSVDPTEPSIDPTEPVVDYVTEPVVGTAYKFRVNQKTAGKVLYLTGEMNGYYFATTENIDEAADVYLEEADGGYYLYVSKDGAKSYMEIVKNGNYTNVVFVSAPTKVLQWNSEIYSVTCDVDGTDYYFGSYNNYVTFSASKISYVTGENAATMDETNFVAHLVTTETDEEPTEPSVDPTEPVISDVSISFADVANRTSLSTSQQVWEQNGITVTNDKSASTSNVADYSNPVRFYKSSSLTVAHAGMTKIEFYCNTAAYAADLANSFTGGTVDGKVVTVEFTEAVDSFTVETLSAQVRVDSITVYAAGATADPTEPTEATEATEPSTEATESGIVAEIVTEPVAGTAYKFMLTQKNLGKQLYLTGSMDGYYFATSDSTVNAADVYLEETDGGYYVYILKSGEKNYMEIVQNGTYTNVVFVTTPTKVLKWNAEINSVTCNVEGEDYYFGTYNTYKTFSASKISYVTGENASALDETNFVGHFVTLKAASVDSSDPTEPTATDVTYVYGSAEGYSNVILNWGKRGAAATFLSPNAIAFYEENNVTYSSLAALSGSSDLSSVASSSLYTTLQELMTTAHTTQTSYGDTRYLYCFTDCQNSDDDTITCFYSGSILSSTWDSGATWNREHCWPKSKTESGTATNSTKGINGDIMTLRPAKSNLNSGRSNTAYGESSNFYNPNGASGGVYDLRGDVARIVLYTYVRWGNTGYMWGADGVMESKEVLLSWIQADPVDTWELGRNDSVESITGTRNVFVDYPELAFILFGESVPADMVTPSGNAA